MGKRRKGREAALQMAYQIDLQALGTENIEGVLQEMPEEAGESASFASYLVRGTWDNLVEIDAAIARYAEHWEASRMAAIDRNILRLAAFELKYAEDIPPKATINEWIEISKKFSTGRSGAFINGVLDRIKMERESKGDKDGPPLGGGG